ncbi:MAG: WD40 repeat domain-containing protein [Polyangiaceae bacterium]
MGGWQFDLVGHTRDVTSASYSPDGRYILTTS